MPPPPSGAAVPLALSYSIDPVYFGITFLAAMEASLLCPPAGLNLHFASAMFGKSIRYAAASVRLDMRASSSGPC